MPVVTVSSKGQIVIPSEIRKKHDIKQGDRFDMQMVDGKLVLIPINKKPFINLYGALKGKTSLTRSLLRERALEIEREEDR
ncbi:AbrB/MazE/SpoVT family DNA-binding domain-containing protein [Desulfofundulus thermobenzoicus]|uniref:AbrB/MazE/SpoVT family DNA-binding domain-containing protein n=1 Tax=Desulfofundulus thermobenzoicus TaxID=29376 RepID=UPI00128F6040